MERDFGATKKAIKRCLECNKFIIEVLDKVNEKKGFCSFECKAEFWKKRQENKTQKRRKKYAKKQEQKKRKPKDNKRKAVLREYRKDYKNKSIEFFKSSDWKRLRFEAFAKHGRQCLCCGARPPSVILHVDHIKPRFNYPELALKLDNLQILCEDCNMGKGARHEIDFRVKT